MVSLTRTLSVSSFSSNLLPDRDPFYQSNGGSHHTYCSVSIGRARGLIVTGGTINDAIHGMDAVSG
jgi:hypothetical protein